MRLLIEGPTGTLMEVNDSHALLPYDDDERAQVFASLTDALALLAGLMPRSTVAKADERGGYSVGSERYPTDHKSGVVVLLSERQGVPI